MTNDEIENRLDELWSTYRILDRHMCASDGHMRFIEDRIHEFERLLEQRTIEAGNELLERLEMEYDDE